MSDAASMQAILAALASGAYRKRSALGFWRLLQAFGAGVP
jgi:hypothetical protein